MLANEQVHVHNERNFPQIKLNSEINVPFLSNEHGDILFLSQNNSAHIILFHLKNKNFYRREKKNRWKRAKHCYSGMQIMTARTSTV